MKKIIFSIAFLICIAHFTFAQNKTEPPEKQTLGSASTKEQGWTPQWKVGDWWDIELEYDASKFSISSREKSSRIVRKRVHFEIISEEKFNGEDVYVLQIKPETMGMTGPFNYTLFLSKPSIFVRKIIIDYGKEISDSYTIDTKTPGPFTRGENFSLYTIPIFPLTSGSALNRYKITYALGKNDKKNNRTVSQQNSLISINAFGETEKIKNKYRKGVFYKTIIDNSITQIWSENIKWYIYFSQNNDIKGCLVDYKNK